jgi:hypothetical protein
MWENRDFYLISLHEKERVIAPLLKEYFGVELQIIKANTDLLGTFSGEIERKNDPLSTLREKIKLFDQLPKDAVVLASEGSFGPHPTLYFVPADDELIMMYDRREKIEIVGRALSTKTNFKSGTCKNIHELKEFALEVKFPTHGLILRPENEPKPLFKGVNDWHKLEEMYHELKQMGSNIHVETDMRAHMNPTRMEVIEEAMKNLIEKMNSFCPNCAHPGWSIKESVRGLPCECCGQATQSTKGYLKKCEKCTFEEYIPLNNGKTHESPEFCNRCNP